MSSYQREGRLAGTTTIATGAFLVSLVMMFAPVAAGTTILHAPYKTLGVQIGYGVSKSGCATTKQVAPSWNHKLATFHAAGTATAPKCAPSPSGNSAFFNAQTDLQGSLHFKVGGSHTITSSWAITEAGSWALVPYSSCALNYKASISECVESASFEVYGFSYLYDQNNGSYFNFGTFLNLNNFTTVENYSQNYCYAGTCSHYGGNFTFPSPGSPLTGSVSQSVVLNSTISATGTLAVNTNDTYSLIIVLYIFVDAEAFSMNAVTTGTASATATCNLATLGNGAQLQSVTIA